MQENNIFIDGHKRGRGEGKDEQQQSEKNVGKIIPCYKPKALNNTAEKSTQRQASAWNNELQESLNIIQS